MKVAAVAVVAAVTAALCGWVAFVGSWLSADRRLDRGHLHE